MWFLAALAWLALAAVSAVGAVLWAFRALDAAAPPPPPLCACFEAWAPLDARWRRACAAFRACAAAPSPLAASAAAAHAGRLAAWAFGRVALRVPPLDGPWYGRAGAAFRDCGCGRGRHALVAVVAVPRVDAAPGDGLAFQWVCPSVADAAPLEFARLGVAAALRAALRPV